MHRLEGKIVLVVGGGGIGGALARRYAAEGAAVMLGDTDLKNATTIVDEITRAGNQAIAVQLDGADEASIAEAISVCLSTYGGLDSAHLNFASFKDNDDTIGIADLGLEIYDETIRINQRGFVLCTRAVLPPIIERGGGAIIYTGSIAAYRGATSRVAYAMAKAAGYALMRHVAHRYGEQGIRANTIAPGTIMHAKWNDLLPQEMKNNLLATQLIKSRLGLPEDIAGLGALLISDEGSFITGQVMCVDGGATMRA